MNKKTCRKNETNNPLNVAPPEPVLPKAAAPEDVATDEELKAVCPDGDFERFKAWFNGMTKVEMFKGFQKQLGVFQKENFELSEKNAKLEEVIAEKDAEIERLKMNIPELANTASVMDKSINVLEDLVQADVVEVVAIPPNPDVKIRPLTYQGHKVRMEKDDGGYYHFWVPRPFAATLLAASFGVKYILIGPDEKMVVKRYGSSRTEEITVYRHVKSQFATGGVLWLPLVGEDESENGDA